MVDSVEFPMARMDTTGFHDRVMVLRLQGEVNRANATVVMTALRSMIDAAGRSGSREHTRTAWPPLVVLNLAELRVLSVAGLDVLARTVEHCAGRGLAARLEVPGSGLVRRVIDVSRIAEWVPVARTDGADWVAADPARRRTPRPGVLDPRTGRVWVPVAAADGAADVLRLATDERHIIV